MGDRTSFLVYSDIKAVLDEMSDEQVGQLFRGMVDYFVAGDDPGFGGVLKFAFIPIRQQMDRDASKYERKCERNRENARKRWGKDNATVCDGMRMHANHADTDTDTDKDKDTDKDTDKDKDKDTDKDTDKDKEAAKSAPVASAPPSLSSFSAEAIAYLNEKAGSNYSASKKVRDQMEKIIKAGYTLDDVMTVVDRKVEEWLHDPKMVGYLRPRTLFGDKFPEYLKAPATVQEKKAEEEKAKREELEIERIEAEAQLHIVEDKLERIRSEDLKEDSVLYETWQEMLDRQAVLQQKIENIVKRTGG